MLQPLVRRTWAPRAQTPLLYSWARHDRFSAISAISVSPIRHSIGLYFHLQASNIRTENFELFVAGLLQHFRRGIILVMDRWQVHRSAGRRLRGRFGTGVDIEWLPPYAPDLNPVEGVWDHSKYGDLANFVPEDMAQLQRAVRRSLRRIQTQQQLLRSFFGHAQLKL